MADPFYVTTPIYYVNARPHIGHAYTTIVADVLARRHRLQGDPTWFLTGTDEHGQKIERSAAAAGIAPQVFADEVSASFSNLWKRMGITNDQFIRTTDEAHKRGVQKLFLTLWENKKIYLSSYTGQYCVSEEMFVDGPPGTIGPDGRPTETVTEENFFFRLSEYQLPLLNLIESGELKITPEARKNEVLSFLRGDVAGTKDQVILSEAQSAEPKDPENVPASRLTPDQPARTAAGTMYQPGALKDLSISRSSFTWGIPVPEAVQREAGATKPHVIYVWLDALANYITALGYGSDDESLFKEFWPADVHLVGKEIIRFHCVYWPAFLLAARLDLPKAVTAHGWLLFDDSKMSKSKGNIVRTETILEAFGRLCPSQPVLSPHEETQIPSLRYGMTTKEPAEADNWIAPLKGTVSAVPQTTLEEAASAAEVRPPTDHERDLFGADALRYFLLREVRFGQDGSFTFDALLNRYTSDLTNGFGNLVSRTLTMISKYFDGAIPAAIVLSAPLNTNTLLGSFVTHEVNDSGAVVHIPSETQALVRVFEKNFPSYRFSAMLEATWFLIMFLDSELTSKAPWKIPVGQADVEVTKSRVELLVMTAESIRIITALLYPILPFATANVWRQLGLGDLREAAARGDLNNLQWGGLQPGTKLGVLSPVFPRADKGLAQTMSDMEQTKHTPQVTEATDASTSNQTDFRETPLASEAGKPTPSRFVDETFTAPSAPVETFDPAAGPRTSAMPEMNPGAQVAGSHAATTERDGTPSHTEAASGIFAGQPAPSDGSQEITIDDFAKVEMRVAKVLVCERIPKADKLLRLEVDLGYERRQILSGIAEWYTPEDLIGRRIVVITNLAPRKMRGLESHGMLLAASSDGGKPALATFGDADVLPLGSRLK